MDFVFNGVGDGGVETVKDVENLFAIVDTQQCVELALPRRRRHAPVTQASIGRAMPPLPQPILNCSIRAGKGLQELRKVSYIGAAVNMVQWVCLIGVGEAYTHVDSKNGTGPSRHGGKLGGIGVQQRSGTVHH